MSFYKKKNYTFANCFEIRVFLQSDMQNECRAKVLEAKNEDRREKSKSIISKK